MTNEEAKDYLKEQVELWSHIVTDYGWRFDVTYCEGSAGMPKNVKDGAPAYSQFEFAYLKAWIYFDLSALCEESKDTLEECVIHELTHLLLSPICLENNDQNKEYCTTTVSLILKELREKAKSET